MATPDPVNRAGATLDTAVERLRDAGATDPVTLMVVGRLQTRLEAIRALARADQLTAELLADELAAAVSIELGASGAVFARHAASGAALLGAV